MAQRRTPPRTAKSDPPRIGAIFAQRMREARSARGWTQQDLADALTSIGAPMDRTTIAKVEKGQREVRLDELVAIAVALDVAIVNLILPIDGDVVLRAPVPPRGRGGPRVRLAPGAPPINQVKARRWARGEIPLDPANFRTYRDQTAGDLGVSDEELPRAERQALWEENEREMRKRGVKFTHEQPISTKRGRSSAGKED